MAGNLVIDGPSSDLVALDAFSVARDGTGGVAYEKRVGGVDHVFVSRFLGGSFGPPQQVDSGLAGPSSEAVLAAGRGGLLLVAFIHSGTLYVVEAPSAGSGFSGPQALAGGALHPALSMNDEGKAYMAFAVAGPGGHDVRAAFFNRGRWAIEGPALDAAAGEDAGSGDGAPAVVASGDGEGIVAWGESGHVYARRIWGTSPSVAVEQADVPSLGGTPEISSGSPRLGTGGDSSFVTLAFQERFAVGTGVQQRVLSRRLHGSQFDGLSQPDGLSTPGSTGAGDAAVAVNEYGRGFITSALTSSNQTIASPLQTNDDAFAPFRVDSLQNTADPHPAPGLAGLKSTLIAWQQTPGTAGPAEIRLRYAQDGARLGPEVVASAPGLGAADAADGLLATGDGSGNAAAVWVQGAPGSRSLVAARLLQPPGGFSATSSFRYANSAQPLLAWRRPAENWGPLRYEVTVDGSTVAFTSATRIRFPILLADGPHSWKVTAFNLVNETSSTRAARVFTDTVAPRARLTVSGAERVLSPILARISATDSPPPLLPGQGSGIASIRLKWGDGTGVAVSRVMPRHIYARPGRYTLTLTLTDRARNKTTVIRRIRIVKPKPKRKHKRRRHR